MIATGVIASHERVVWWQGTLDIVGKVVGAIVGDGGLGGESQLPSAMTWAPTWALLWALTSVPALAPEAMHQQL